MIQMQITLPENVMNAIRAKADHCGLTPNAHTRMQLCQLNYPDEPDGPAKSYLIELENWREIETYVEMRGYKSIGYFLQKTAEAFMKKYHLSEEQKAEAGELLQKRKKSPAFQSADA